MSFVDNYSKVCRTCLAESCKMKSIFSVGEFLEQPTVLSEILRTCASVQVLQGDGLPEQLCLNCIKEMNRAFLFRKMCEKSDATLRHCLPTLIPLSTNYDSNSSLPVKFKNERNDASSHEKTDLFVPKVDLFEKEISKHETNDVFLNEEFKNVTDELCIERGSDSDEYYDRERIFNRKKRIKKKNLKEACLKKRNYSCKICQEQCFGLGAYRRHMTNAHEQAHKCDACDKRFKSETVLTRHKVFYHKVTLSTSKSDDIQKHNTTSYKSKTGIVKKRNLPRTCTICNKTFRFHSNLERHQLIHTGERPYLCNVCGKGFAQLSYLKIHSFIHTGEKPYKCKMCEKSFAAPGTLMTHIRTHTGERPHVCKICGKDFPQSGYLSAHIRTHTGEKPVECKVCHRRFNQSGRLIIHMRIHSGEKPYSCTECGRSFAVKGTLKKHIRTHTGERPYICTVCGQAFAQSGTLATHMKVHRPK